MRNSLGFAQRASILITVRLTADFGGGAGVCVLAQVILCYWAIISPLCGGRLDGGGRRWVWSESSETIKDLFAYRPLK